MTTPRRLAQATAAATLQAYQQGTQAAKLRLRTLEDELLTAHCQAQCAATPHRQAELTAQYADALRLAPCRARLLNAAYTWGRHWQEGQDAAARVG